jgi:hypothetical protein
MQSWIVQRQTGVVYRAMHRPCHSWRTERGTGHRPGHACLKHALHERLVGLVGPLCNGVIGRLGDGGGHTEFSRLGAKIQDRLQHAAAQFRHDCFRRLAERQRENAHRGQR